MNYQEPAVLVTQSVTMVPPPIVMPDMEANVIAPLYTIYDDESTGALYTGLIASDIVLVDEIAYGSWPNGLNKSAISDEHLFLPWVKIVDTKNSVAYRIPDTALTISGSTITIDPGLDSKDCEILDQDTGKWVDADGVYTFTGAPVAEVDATAPDPNLKLLWLGKGQDEDKGYVTVDEITTQLGFYPLKDDKIEIGYSDDTSQENTIDLVNNSADQITFVDDIAVPGGATITSLLYIHTITGDISVTARCYERTKMNRVFQLNTANDIITNLGAIHIANPLALAASLSLLNTEGKAVYATPVDITDTSGWQKAADGLYNEDKVYAMGIVAKESSSGNVDYTNPQGEDVKGIFENHINAKAAPEEGSERRAFLWYELLPWIQKIIADAVTPKTADSVVPASNKITDADGDFIDLGVLINDYLYLEYQQSFVGSHADPETADTITPGDPDNTVRQADGDFIAKGIKVGDLAHLEDITDPSVPVWKRIPITKVEKQMLTCETFAGTFSLEYCVSHLIWKKCPVFTVEAATLYATIPDEEDENMYTKEYYVERENDELALSENARQFGAAILDRRITYQVAPTALITYGGVQYQMPGAFFTASGVAHISAKKPGQPLSKMIHKGIDNVAGLSTFRRKEHLNLMASGGATIIEATAAGPQTRHLLTTNMTSVKVREVSPGVAWDNLARIYRQILHPYVARHNISKPFLDFCLLVATSINNFATNKKGILRKITLVKLYQGVPADGEAEDSVYVILDVISFYPANNFRITLQV